MLLFGANIFNPDWKWSHKRVLNTHLSAYFYEHSIIKERDDCISMAIKKIALIEDANDAYVFRNSYMKIFICKLSKYFLHFNAKFEWDIVLSSSHDGWDKKRGYTMCDVPEKALLPS